MTEDQNQIETSSDEDEIPTFAEAVKERKKDIASLRKEGQHETADTLAKCRKGNRCLSLACPVCYRRRQLAFSRYPELAIHDSDELFRFVLYELSVDAIKVIGPRRPIDEKKLAALKASIKLIGLQTPITVRMQKSKFVLVTGWYRLTAVKQLGKATISCFCSQIDDEMDRYLWQRAENVIRAEPRVLERAEYINEMRVAILQQGGKLHPPVGISRRTQASRKLLRPLGSRRRMFAGQRGSRRWSRPRPRLRRGNWASTTIRAPFFRSQSCRRTLSAQQLLQLSRLSVPHALALPLACISHTN
jgi:ParB/RepB/Spo0J family partition protein